MSEALDKLKALFDSIEIGKTYNLEFNKPYEPMTVTIWSKKKESEVSYSIFCNILGTQYGGYLWVRPAWIHHYNRRIIKATPYEKTNCIRQCRVKDGVCLGCKRTLEEIITAGNKK